MNASATIIVPVFNAYEYVERCLDSIARTVADNQAVLLVDDASSDPRISPLLKNWSQERSSWRVLSNASNLGFVQTVNRAIADTEGDVVLLNSDTLVHGCWLDALQRCAGNIENLATATPFSNNAEICSYPNFCESNLPCEHPELLIQAMREVGPPQYPELPTGVGFCMLVTRRALDLVGSFDADTFGVGYGEENDFCLRCSKAGLRNVLCDDAYVIHQGGASFSAIGHAPNGDNLRRLNEKHPGYDALVADFIDKDPIKPIRAKIASRYAQLLADSQPHQDPLPFTGERFTPECVREIAYEHWHRYAFAQPLICELEVLDIACGEGYGSAMLAESAATVIGVDIDQASVDHATRRYGPLHTNLRYERGSATAIPLADNSVDAVVSFETIEHIHEQQELLQEIARVLRDDGFLIISSPDRRMYSDVTGFVNEHHVKELYREEFEALLDKNFPRYAMFGQKLLFQSAIWQLGSALGPESHAARLNHGRVEHSPVPAYDPIYFIAICANKASALPKLPRTSLYGDAEESVYEHYNDEVRRNIHAGSVIKEMEKHLDYLKQRVADLESAEPERRSWWARILNPKKN